MGPARRLEVPALQGHLRRKGRVRVRSTEPRRAHAITSPPTDRLQRALRRMWDETGEGVPRESAMLAAATGGALRALVEAAEAWRAANGSVAAGFDDEYFRAIRGLTGAVDRWLAATEGP